MLLDFPVSSSNNYGSCYNPPEDLRRNYASFATREIWTRSQNVENERHCELPPSTSKTRKRKPAPAPTTHTKRRKSQPWLDRSIADTSNSDGSRRNSESKIETNFGNAPKSETEDRRIDWIKSIQTSFETISEPETKANSENFAKSKLDTAEIVESLEIPDVGRLLKSHSIDKRIVQKPPQSPKDLSEMTFTDFERRIISSLSYHTICSICQETPTARIVTICFHIYCRECATRLFETAVVRRDEDYIYMPTHLSCPYCRQNLLSHCFNSAEKQLERPFIPFEAGDRGTFVLELADEVFNPIE